jgi:hypothetical protein
VIRPGRWQATHGMDGRPLAPYVSPSERWPAAGELFGPIWRLRDLRPDGGEASLPTRSVGLTFTRGAPASVSVRITAPNGPVMPRPATLRTARPASAIGPTTSSGRPPAFTASSASCSSPSSTATWPGPCSRQPPKITSNSPSRRSAHCTSEPIRHDQPSTHSFGAAHAILPN